MAAEPFPESSQNPTHGVSFRELNEDLDETARAQQKDGIFKEQPTHVADAYVITNSDYAGTSTPNSNCDNRENREQGTQNLQQTK